MNILNFNQLPVGSITESIGLDTNGNLIKAEGNSSSNFLVTVTQDDIDNQYVFDKTYEEVLNAIYNHLNVQIIYYDETLNVTNIYIPTRIGFENSYYNISCLTSVPTIGSYEYQLQVVRFFCDDIDEYPRAGSSK